jgi:hypothetical protein
MDYLQAGLSDFNFITISQYPVWTGAGLNTKHQPKFQLQTFLKHRKIILVQSYGHPIPVFHFDVGPGMVNMTMSVQNDNRFKVQVGNKRENPLSFSPRVYDGTFPALLTEKKITISFQWTNNYQLIIH